MMVVQQVIIVDKLLVELFVVYENVEEIYLLLLLYLHDQVDNML